MSSHDHHQYTVGLSEAEFSGVQFTEESTGSCNKLRRKLCDCQFLFAFEIKLFIDWEEITFTNLFSTDIFSH